ncbi:hemolysin family protein [Candidatus Albibeggiatoa sp. nov. BB20]|uniref:hemolysin family protein n=1 Tax=Candidatus Albibeggiatoa sp. nov. BB20 TaxID=3162723 RepID=UPI003365AEBC
MDAISNYLQAFWLQTYQILAFDTALLFESEVIFRLGLQVFLLLSSSFFAGSESALFSLSRLDLQHLRKKQHSSSETIHALLDQPRRLIISILCGNELVNIAASANMAGILVILYGDGDEAFWINIFVMVPLLLLFGEITPKTVAVSQPVAFSSAIYKPLNLWIRLISPLRAAIRAVADRVTTYIVGEAKDRENILQVDEFRSLVEDVSEEGVLDATERALIYNLLEAGDVEVVEIMTPRTQTRFFSSDMSMDEVVKKFKEYRHARVPVFKNQRDNVVGFVHAEDILRLVLDNADLTQINLEQIIRPPVVVPLTKRVDEMFDFFKEHNVRAAVVLNEFGGVEGFVTLTDVLTFIFGPITGEAKGQEYYQEEDNNVYEVPGEMKLNDFNNLTRFGIEDPRMTTVGGVIFRHLDRLPKQNDKVVIEDLVFTVLKMDGHRIARVHAAKKGLYQEPEELEIISTSAEPERIEQAQNIEQLTDANHEQEVENSSIIEDIPDTIEEHKTGE